MNTIFLLRLFAFSQIVLADPPHQYIVENINSKKRILEIQHSSREQEADAIYYNSERTKANPFVSYPFVTIKEAISEKENLIYSTVYHTGLLGWRITPGQNLESLNHLILSGDSNIFGFGVADQETLPAKLTATIHSHNVYNFGLAGTGPNNTLYFLEHFDIKKILVNKTTGVFIYDFHHYLIERIIGSKAYTAWSIDSPRYELENGTLIYKGSTRKYWLTWFYKFLNIIPYNQKLIPNLPRINQSHIELTAKIFAKIKIEYLRQTDTKNRFFVLFNPSFINATNTNDIEYLKERLIIEGIEVIYFKQNEILPMPLIKGDGHFSAIAHENYSQMIIKKLNPLLR
jgi:hypothetical protein